MNVGIEENLAAREPHGEEECRPFPRYIEVDRLARAYVPPQKMCNIYCHETGLKNGTIFPELFMPYEPR
jgi:hypothetical protein